jgi:hypothetical protein
MYHNLSDVEEVLTAVADEGLSLQPNEIGIRAAFYDGTPGSKAMVEPTKS